MISPATKAAKPDAMVELARLYMSEGMGVEAAGVLQLIKDLRDRGMSIILISHNMPQVFDVADRIHVQRLGRRAAVVTPQSHQMQDVVAIMTGAMTVPEAEQQLTPIR